MPNDNEIIETWFGLRHAMLGGGQSAVGARPASLREACYALALSMRSADRSDPMLIESYVNGLEIGAMSALQAAWKSAQRAPTDSDETTRLWMSKQKKPT